MPQIESLRLSQLAAQVEQVLKDAFSAASFWVIADVTNHTFKANTSYHYFELVEKVAGTEKLLAKFSAKAWGDGSREIRVFESKTGQRFTSNIQVLVRVKVEFHATFGIQLTVTGIDPNFTIGIIEQQRQATLERLVKDNPEFIRKSGEEYITRNKEVNLAAVIQKIAVISAKGSAGLQDFLHTVEHNSYGYRYDMQIFFTEVQGEANAPAMREVLINIFKSSIPYDLVVIIRGGGSQTDLLLFDNYLIGQAIARFPIPVLTGIGHQKNTTVADLMAHTAMKTPTKSAEFIIEHNRRFEEKLITLQQQIIIKAQQYLHANQIILANLSANMLSQPKITIGAKRQQLANILSNIRTFQSMYFKNKRGYVGHYESVIRLVSPVNTLRRGFALVLQNGKIVSEPELLAPHTDITIILKETELTAMLKDKKPYHGS